MQALIKISHYGFHLLAQDGYFVNSTCLLVCYIPQQGMKLQTHTFIFAGIHIH